MTSLLQKLVFLEVLSILLGSAACLDCHTCVNYECEPGFDKDCGDIAQIVWDSITPYRQTSALRESHPSFVRCPEVNDTEGWTMLQNYLQREQLSTCRYDGQIRLNAPAWCGKTGFHVMIGKKFKRRMVMYGTLLGCSSWEFLKQMCAMGKCIKNYCGERRWVTSSTRNLNFEEIAVHYKVCTLGMGNGTCTNCRECNDGSYCIQPEESIPTKPEVPKTGLSMVGYVLIGALGLAVVIAAICFRPKKRVIQGDFQFDENTLGIVRKL